MNRNPHNETFSHGDYPNLFESSKEPLEWLCYTLTGDGQLSAMVVDAALQQSLKGAGPVFREWMSSWARRLIIRFCIVTASPTALEAAPACSCRGLESFSMNSFDRELMMILPAHELQRRLLRLEILPRFVFVLRALEGYSRRDTALLLNIDDRSCEREYLRALAGMCIEKEQAQNIWNSPSAEVSGLAQAGD